MNSIDWMFIRAVLLRLIESANVAKKRQSVRNVEMHRRQKRKEEKERVNVKGYLIDFCKKFISTLNM